MGKTVYLILENGRVFEGKRFGLSGEVTGEIVFTTGMCGYLETLTDPSYYGQIVVQTFPLIGNYGVIPSDFESASVSIKAYIVREWCQEPSNYRSEGTLDTFFKEKGIIGIYGIDTRELTKVIRESGVMNARIMDSLEEKDKWMEEIRSYRIVDAVNAVSCEQTTEDQAEDERYRVVLWDFGAKQNIKRELLKRGCTVITVPGKTTAEEILKLRPDGVMLSNGPGDPAENTGIIREIQKLCQAQMPIFGICLGHQLLALSQGGKTFKLKYGHRGANQPVIDLKTRRVYITSQNHGYAVSGKDLPSRIRIAFENANDGTCEGISYQDIPAFSVQFHPEAAAGPQDTMFLFDRFLQLMEENSLQKAL